MIVFCDDGSTATKLSWFDTNNKLQTSVITNGFTSSWKSSGFGITSYNYLLEDQRYSYSPNSHEIEVTTNIRYQYNGINALGIQQALQESGLKPQLIDIVVTLPISEYYDSDSQENTQNIKNKIKNIKRKISLNKGNVFTFNNVYVYPESIPALVPELEKTHILDYEKSLILDLGGTTLDCGLIMGEFKDVIKVSGAHNIGTQSLIKEISNALLKADTCMNFNDTDIFIRKMLNNEDIAPLVNNIEQIPKIKEQLVISLKKLAKSCVNHIEQNYEGFQRIYITGGGQN
ncbi:plasmid segregation protein ParM domain-containing protein [Xenorhabdus ishibashii]|uniref:Plasmid segregation protein ParM n=1 Tax=Xenorhabdus ishibashii TaxID=1034471 RepID=A0A2D0K825_9GAMM|nr:plasmid segregation protein ParM domain-containing protein [Xenorhabdus ishibashii]PHM59510.1 Plasmid segregation protein ParM [Xenorhabdus ishibashii]